MKDSTPYSQPSAGDVLIAHPDMPPNPFAETLVFLHSFSDEGALGLILNRPTGQHLGDMIQSSDFPDALKALPVYYGGPVQDQHFLLSLFICDPQTHTFRCEINPDQDQLKNLTTEPQHILRAFVGYAGWSGGQLNGELANRDWYWTAPDDIMLSPYPTPELWHLLASGDRRWQTLRDYLPAHPENN